jgi:protocatechuate 3,4-dioxygenase beta subunit
VSGKVTVKGKGLSGIGVSLRPVNSNQRNLIFSGRTDEEGNYRIGNIPAGTYQIAPAAPEFSLMENQPRVLILSAGESVDAIDFSLVRGGVITGKVTSSSNQPLIEATISYTVERTDEAGTSSRTESRFQTDDRGVYRIFGLTPGKYKLAVTRDPGRGPSLLFTPTYYPATTDPSKATLIEVTEGSELTGIDINIELNEESSEKFTVKGRTIDGVNGQPVPNVRLRLAQVDQNSTHYLDLTSTSDGQGQFNFEDVVPGQYAVFGEPSPTTSLRADRLGFVVTDRDVTDLVVKTLRTSSVSGVVVFESTSNKVPLGQFGRLFLYAYTTTGNSGRPETARVNEDGSFHLIGLTEGVSNFSLGSSFGGPPKGLTISRVERDGVVQNGGIEIKESENITGVRVVLKYANGTIRGIVKMAGSELPRNARVFVWLGNAQGEPRSFRTSPVVVDARGNFIIEGVADGTYEINASVTLPGSRNRPFTAKQQVIVSEGSTSDVVTLTVDVPLDPGVKQ